MTAVPLGSCWSEIVTGRFHQCENADSVDDYVNNGNNDNNDNNDSNRQTNRQTNKFITERLID